METPETNPQNPELVPATSEMPAHVPATPEEVRATEAELNPHPDQGPDPAPPSAAPAVVPPSAPAENHQPTNNEVENDSLGNAKEPGMVGPRGANVSPEHLTEIQKAESVEAADRRAHAGMSSTDHIDSIGAAKGDQKTGEPHQPMVGPRGVGVPKDSFHKARN